MDTMSHRQRRPSLFGLGAAPAALLLLSASAWAERPTDQYWLQLHAFRPTIESTARADALATNRPGTELSFEDDLGMSDRETLPSVLLGMRFFDNWRFDFEYYTLKRDASRVTEREINFGDESFDLATQLSSSFESSIYRLTVGYSFIKSQEVDLGVAIGLHLTDFELTLAGANNLGGSVRRETKDALAPLPTIGLYGSYAFSPAFGVRARADLLSLEYGDYDGSLTNVELAVDWRFHPNYAVGAAYRYVNYELKASSSSWNGEVNYKFKGPTLFFEAAF
jgi:opacity protein-like surface antigen